MRGLRMLAVVTGLTLAFAGCGPTKQSGAAPPGPLADASTHTAGWTLDSKTGCAVWNPVPLPNESVTWLGACRDGVADGPGVEQWYKGFSPGQSGEEVRDKP